MACCGCGNTTCRGPAGPAGPTSAEVIFSQSDLPNPSGGVITLAADTTYWIAGEVTIDAGIAVVMSSGTCLMGNGKYCSRLIGDVDGAAFLRGPSSLDMNIEDLGVENDGNGDVISHNAGGAADTHLINVLIDGNSTAADGAALTAPVRVDLHNCDFIDLVAAGVSLAGACGDVDVEGSLFTSSANGILLDAAATADRLSVTGSNFDGCTSSAIDLTGTSVTHFQVDGCSFDMAAGSIGIEFTTNVTVTDAIIGDSLFIVPGTAVGISTVAGTTITDATASGNSFTGAGTYLGGTLTSQTDGWLFGDNVGVEDTAFIGELSFYSAGGLSVTGGAAPAGDIADTAAVQAAIAAGALANFQADGVTGAKLQYIGNKSALFKITAELTGAITAGAAVRVLQLLVNDVAVGRQASAELGATTLFRQLNVSHTVELAPGDIVSANIDANVTEMSSYHLTAVAAE